eukprot:656086-Pelagomonas_calceolata.AAC.6
MPHARGCATVLNITMLCSTSLSSLGSSKLVPVPPCMICITPQQMHTTWHQKELNRCCSQVQGLKFCNLWQTLQTYIRLISVDAVAPIKASTKRVQNELRLYDTRVSIAPV